MKILCVHVDTGNGDNLHEKATKLDELLKNKSGENNLRVALFESDDVAKGIRTFAGQNNIDLVSFAKIKRSSLYKMFHHNLLGKMVLTQQVPMLIFPV